MTLRIEAVWAALFALTSAAAAPTAWARRITLNDTGVTQCVDSQKHWSSECAESGQDAADGRDVHDPAPEDGLAGFSFRKVCRSGQMAGEGSCPADPVRGGGPDDWGCTHDNITRLTWEVKTDDGGVHDHLRIYTNKGRRARDDNSDAAWLIDATNAEALCGAATWRLPDVLELQSIVDHGVGHPDRDGALIDPTFFPDTRLPLASWSPSPPRSPWTFWTRDAYVHDAKLAWYVDFGDGGVGRSKRFNDTSNARLVHGTSGSAASWSDGQTALAKDRFIPSDDGTEVTDTMTGLVWRRCAEGMAWNNTAKTCDGNARMFRWQDAIEYAKANHQGGWRFANLKELHSIVDYSKLYPAINLLAFPNSPSLSFLSSTPLNHSGALYWQEVKFDDGRVERARTDIYGSWPLRFVRSGRE
jgi:hypothetical protein